MSVFILGSARIPFVRSFTSYADRTTQELMLESLKNLVQKYKLDGETLGDVALGAVMKSSNDWNLARECVLGTTLHPRTPAYDVQRACGTSLENALQLQLKIESGRIESAIAGGVDTNSDLPFLFRKSFARKMLELNQQKGMLGRLQKLAQFSLQDLKPVVPAVVEPRTRLSMGQHCELMVKEWKISREAQDKWAIKSHKSADQAYKAGFFKDLVFPFNGVEKDGFVRGDSTLEKLAQLKPAFDKSGAGTLTAGNSSPLTDGSACVLLGNESFASRKNLQPLARIVDGEVAAFDFVAGEGLLMAPALAVAKLLKRMKLSLQDFDYYEIHEAFAGQVLCTLKAWEDDAFCRQKLGAEKALGSIDPEKINVCGGSLAIGHPFAATGARILCGLAKTLAQNKSGSGKKRGLISVCTAGGMGVVAVLESV